MTLLSLVVTLVVIGVVLYLIQLIPMDATIKKVIWVLVILFVLLWVLGQLGFVSDHVVRVR